MDNVEIWHVSFPSSFPLPDFAYSSATWIDTKLTISVVEDEMSPNPATTLSRSRTAVNSRAKLHNNGGIFMKSIKSLAKINVLLATSGLCIMQCDDGAIDRFKRNYIIEISLTISPFH